MTIRPHALLIAFLSASGCADPSVHAPAPPAPPTARHAAMAAFPALIPLPDGFWPEGITFGRGTTFYVGSLATGGIWQGDARTGTGSLLVAEQPGREMVGMKYDERSDRLFVAAGFGGAALVYDAGSGALLAEFPLAEPGTALINDLVITRDAVWITDSFNPVLYRIPLRRNGVLPAPAEVQTIPLTGDFVHVEDTPIGNANGIVATPDGKRLIIVNTTTGALYNVDTRTGVATAIDLGDATVEGDGLLLVGHTLYVVQGHLDQITVLRLAPDYLSGTVERAITSPDLQFPSTIARLGASLYAVNARFDVEYSPGLAYHVVRLPR